jgi:dihydroorotase
MYDLILAGGRVVDPHQSLDQVADVAFLDGRVAEIKPSIDHSAAREIRDVTGKIVCPGLIDLHTHVYWGGTSLGIHPEPVARRSGTTTFVDAGSAGAGTLEGFRKHVMERTKPRILAYLNISFPGIYAFSGPVMVGECEDLRLLNARECLAVAQKNRDIVVGIKARVGSRAGGASGLAPLQLAVEVAEEAGLPVMAHIDMPPPTRKEVLETLRPGDILTHCFRPFPSSPVRPDGTVRPEMHEARERGIIFDIGHGYGGFSFKAARAMLDAGIMPDVISSDIHVLCIDGPAYDVLAVMSKFMALGMSLNDVVRAATCNPAHAMRTPDLGTLKPGAAGDATVLELRDGRFAHKDVLGEVVMGENHLFNVGTVIAGAWWADGDAVERP